MDVKKWLSEKCNLATSVFHIGSYCAQWLASTFMMGKPSFHILVKGNCWLQIGKNTQRIRLEEGDVVFFFKNREFYLTSSQYASISSLPAGKLLPISANVAGSTSLICGFLESRCDTLSLIFALMPEIVIVNKSNNCYQRMHFVIELLKIECLNNDVECDIKICRLTDLLIMYVMEAEIIDRDLDINMMLVEKYPRLVALMLEILSSPNKKWSIDEMACFSHMSRSTFIRKLSELCGYTPNELLTRLRINIAKKLLRRGLSIEQVAYESGYQSIVGFYRAFKRVNGHPPRLLDL